MPWITRELFNERSIETESLKVKSPFTTTIEFEMFMTCDGITVSDPVVVKLPESRTEVSREVALSDHVPFPQTNDCGAVPGQ